ncbi:MAG: bifunctional phosphoglucose/phosphomannose isomerase [Anaerolineales bacterium]|nr:bifunctional phosphoglucose/phosphomannose isomerase [Anaerolineales bacterium]
MNLDEQDRFHEVDPEGMLAEIDGLPDQLQAAWDLGQSLPLPIVEGIRQVVIAGMGGSAIGGDLLAAYVAPRMSIPVIVWRNYDLPAFASGPGTLVITASHSGNTEETLSAFERGREAGVSLMAITTGGELARRAGDHSVPLWRFEHSGQPRAAVGYSFGLLLAALTRQDLIPDTTDEVVDSVAAMNRQQKKLRADIPVTQNPAKRLAGQMMERWPTIVGAGLLAPVARRWRTQVSELAKSVAQFEELPEADHNMVAGVVQPESLFGSTMVVFLRASLNHPRNIIRVDATNRILMVEGFGTNVIQARGDTRLAQQWTCLHFGDYTAYYLAMAYGIDPTPVAAIEGLKEILVRAEM